MLPLLDLYMGCALLCLFPRSLDPHLAFGDVWVLQQRKSESARVLQLQWASLLQDTKCICDLRFGFRSFAVFMVAQYGGEVWTLLFRILVFADWSTMDYWLWYFNEYSNYSMEECTVTKETLLLELFSYYSFYSSWILVGFLAGVNLRRSMYVFIKYVRSASNRNMYYKECIASNLAFFLAWT